MLLFACLVGCAPGDEGSRFIQKQAYAVGHVQPSLDAMTWKPYKGTLSAGYGSEPVWIKLQVSPLPEVASSDFIELRVGPSSLDQIELYDRTMPSGVQKSVGEWFSSNNNAQMDFEYNFNVPNGVAPREILIRVKSSYLRVVRIAAHSSKEARQINTKLAIKNTVIILLLTLTVGLAFYISRIYKDTVAAAFPTLQSIAFLHGFFELGFSRLLLDPFISPEILGLVSRLLIIGYSFANFGFYFLWLKSYGLDKEFCGLLKILLSSLAIVVATYGYGAEWLAFKINSIITLLWMAIQLAASIIGISWGSYSDRPELLKRNIVIGYLSFILVLNIACTTGIFTALDGGFFAVHGSVFNGLYTGALIIGLLHFRAVALKDNAKTINLNYLKEKRLGEQRELFLNILTHELNSPLSVILIASQSEKLSDKLKELAAEAAISMSKILELGRESLAYLEGIATHNLEPVNLGELLRQLINARLDAERFRIDVDFAGCIFTDKNLLSIIIRNLFENAAKYSPKHSSIFVHLFTDVTKEVCVSVSNENTQQSSLPLACVFDKYWRSPDVRDQQGFGLGLYLAQQLTNTLRGRLVPQVTGNIICFTLILPLTK